MEKVKELLENERWEWKLIKKNGNKLGGLWEEEVK